MPADYRETLFTRRGLYPRRFRRGERATFERLMLRFAEYLQGRLQRWCPVRTGRLRDSIRVNVTLTDLIVRVRMLFYGRYVRRVTTLSNGPNARACAGCDTRLAAIVRWMTLHQRLSVSHGVIV